METQKRKKYSILLSIIFGMIALIFIFRQQISDGLACLAYYEQCTAEPIHGLTHEQCFARDDVVVYLIQKKICLVKPNKE